MANYTLNYSGAEVDALLNKIDTAFGETTIVSGTLNWDNNTAGLYNVVGMFYKISDSMPTLAELQQGGSMTFAGNEIQFTASAVMDLGAVGMGKDCAVVMDGSDPLVGIVYKAGATATMSGMTVMFEETGVYFLYNAQYGVGVSSLVINNYTGFETTEVIKIPSKFIPEHEPEAVFTIESSEMGNLNDDGKVITCNKSIVELISKTELTSVRVKWNGYILFPTYSAIIPENGMVVVGFAYEGKHYAVVYTPIGFSVTTYTYA